VYCSGGSASPLSRKLDPGAHEVLRRDGGLQNTEALAAERAQAQDPELLHVPVGDGRETAHELGRRRPTDLLAVADQADAERLLRLQAFARHVHVARLEHPQRQEPAGVEHRVEREDRQAAEVGLGRRRNHGPKV
jgi:hypothetical protein